MHPEKEKFLNLRTKPARVTPEQAAWRLGFEPHDIPVLVREKVLKPLGKPPVNGTKHFATVELDELAADSRWLAGATNKVHEHWQKKSSQREAGCTAPHHNGVATAAAKAA